ncbi:hypothetical protein CALVIDRAFT_469081, partial [Calocera viscosa TUFC12733]
PFTPPPPPPKRSWWTRFTRRLDQIPLLYVRIGIIAVNVLVFLLWRLGMQNYTRFRDDQPLRFLLENFATSWQNYKAGRWWTLLTSCFSQQQDMHLLVNCISLWFTADAVMSVIGVSRFMGVYLLGGAASSLVSILWRGDQPGYSVGASGAVYSCLSMFAFMYPRTQFLLFFILPVPAWLCLGGIFVWDSYEMLRKGRNITGSDNAGHLGGLLAG